MHTVVLDLKSVIHIIDHTDKIECTTLCGLSFNRHLQNILSMDDIAPNTCKNCIIAYELINGTDLKHLDRNVSQQNILFKLHRKDSLMVSDERMKLIPQRLWKKLARYRYLVRRPKFVK